MCMYIDESRECVLKMHRLLVCGRLRGDVLGTMTNDISLLRQRLHDTRKAAAAPDVLDEHFVVHPHTSSSATVSRSSDDDDDQEKEDEEEDRNDEDASLVTAGDQQKRISHVDDMQLRANAGPDESVSPLTNPTRIHSGGDPELRSAAEERARQSISSDGKVAQEHGDEELYHDFGHVKHMCELQPSRHSCCLTPFCAWALGPAASRNENDGAASSFPACMMTDRAIQLDLHLACSHGGMEHAANSDDSLARSHQDGTGDPEHHTATAHVVSDDPAVRPYSYARRPRQGRQPAEPTAEQVDHSQSTPPLSQQPVLMQALRRRREEKEAGAAAAAATSTAAANKAAVRAAEAAQLRQASSGMLPSEEDEVAYVRARVVRQPHSVDDEHSTYRLLVSLQPSARSVYTLVASIRGPLILPAAYQVPRMEGGVHFGGTNPLLWEGHPALQFGNTMAYNIMIVHPGINIILSDILSILYILVLCPVQYHGCMLGAV